MADRNVTRIRYFEIVPAAGRRVGYGRRYEESAVEGDYRDKVSAAVESWMLPERLDGERGLAQEIHAMPRPTLDLDAASDEVCAYVFVLNVPVTLNGKDQTGRLTFAREPFLEIPLYSETNEVFLTDFRLLNEVNQWASFVCDHQKVRRSELAKRIRKVLEGHTSMPLRIPFFFNFVDPVLKASPLTVPPDDDEDPVRRSLYIHGGVHPNSLASLEVQL